MRAWQTLILTLLYSACVAKSQIVMLFPRQAFITLVLVEEPASFCAQTLMQCACRSGLVTRTCLTHALGSAPVHEQDWGVRRPVPHHAGACVQPEVQMRARLVGDERPLHVHANLFTTFKTAGVLSSDVYVHMLQANMRLDVDSSGRRSTAVAARSCRVQNPAVKKPCLDPEIASA